MAPSWDSFPVMVGFGIKLRIFPSHPILDLWWSLFNAPTLSLLLFAPLISVSLTVKSAQWDRPAAYCPAHPLIPSSPPSLLHAPSITQMFDCRLCLTFWYVLILSHLTRHIPPLAFSSCCHPSLYPTKEGGKGGKKKKTLLSPLPYNHTPFAFIV